MLLWIFGALIVFISLLIIDVEDGIDRAVISVSILFAISVYIITLIIIALPNETIINEIPIISVRDSKIVSGNFVLGSGSVKGEEYYFYFEKIGKNKYKRGQIKTLSTILIENDNVKPKIRRVYIVSNRKWKKILVGDYKINPIQKTCELIVPKGTIIQRFEVQ